MATDLLKELVIVLIFGGLLACPIIFRKKIEPSEKKSRAQNQTNLKISNKRLESEEGT